MTQTTEPLAGRGRVEQAAPRSLHAGRPVRYCVEHVFVLSVEREVGRTAVRGSARCRSPTAATALTRPPNGGGTGAPARRLLGAAVVYSSGDWGFRYTERILREPERFYPIRSVAWLTEPFRTSLTARAALGPTGS